MAMTVLRRVPPKTLEELKTTAEAFSELIDQEENVKFISHLRQRARVGRKLLGASFEGQLNKQCKSHSNEK